MHGKHGVRNFYAWGVLLPLASFALFYFFPTWKRGFAEKEAIIILLNGPSASGKTSIQKEFQKFYDHQFLRVGTDTLYCALLDMRAFSGDSPVATAHVSEKEGHKEFAITHNEQGHKIAHGMHKALAGYAAAGNSLIVDYISYEPQWIFDVVKELRPFRVYTVGIKTPLDVIEEREKARKTSPEGHARSHYESVHQGWVYDLEVDTHQESAAQIALQIKEYIETHKPHAFADMSRDFTLKQIFYLWVFSFGW